MRPPPHARRRSAFPAALALAALVLPLLSQCSSTPAGEARRPNVLFIAVDDLRPELGCYGAEHVVSPNIDRLAAGGTVFTRAYCQQAVCNPSRASLLTGLRPDSLRVWDLRTDFRETRPEALTIPQHFKQSGYHSAGIGKIFHNVLPDPLSWSETKLHVDGFPFDPDAVYVAPENVERVEARKAQILERGNQARFIDRYGQWYLKTVATEIADAPDDAYFDGAQTTRALEKLSELKDGDEPFFLAVGYYRPHLPFNAPRKYWDLYDRDEVPLATRPEPTEGAPPMAVNNMRELRGYQDFRDAPLPYDAALEEDQARLLKHGYLASVSYVDAQVGRLLDALDELGLADDTIVVLWGDHGWKLGEHRSWGKMTNYEVDARVPLIVKAPGKRGGQRSEALVELVDVFPTLCDLAGLETPAGLEGTSAAPLLADPRRPWKPAIFHQFLREGIWVAPDGVVYMGHAIRTDRHRYVEWAVWETGAPAARELYDLELDPHETCNRVDDPSRAELVAGLSKSLHAGWRAALPAH